MTYTYTYIHTKPRNHAAEPELAEYIKTQVSPLTRIMKQQSGGSGPVVPHTSYYDKTPDDGEKWWDLPGLGAGHMHIGKGAGEYTSMPRGGKKTNTFWAHGSEGGRQQKQEVIVQNESDTSAEAQRVKNDTQTTERYGSLQRAAAPPNIMTGTYKLPVYQPGDDGSKSPQAEKVDR